MQVKLWPQVEEGLKKLAEKPENARMKISVSKIANFALAQYITHKQISSRKK